MKHKEYSNRIIISKNDERFRYLFACRRFGIVKRKNGKTFLRNYGRELKNGKGLTFGEAFGAAIKSCGENTYF